MKGFDVYQQQSASWTRIDMLLAAYDGAIARLKKAHQMLTDDNEQAARPLLIRAQRIVLELYAGLDLRHGQIPENMQRLYLYVLHAIGQLDAESIASAVTILERIREGLKSIREEAIELERTGAVHPVDHDPKMILQAIG
ncbi:MAG: flagellar protein FliS [Planctomycetes bacterium]|nr:flagellar protein FliS [Planctomycetota bacterium]